MNRFTCFVLGLLFSLAGAAVHAGAPVRAGEPRPLVDLRGTWRFEIGDNPRWAEKGFDDSRWAEVFVPSSWEDEGFPGYDGFAWYRRHVTLPAEWSGKPLLINLGTIDDVDEVYINGTFVGFKGVMPPDMHTAYSELRAYPIPPGVLKFGGENVIAVRVYDAELAGGIVSGKPGLYEREEWIEPDLAIESGWKLRQGDDAAWKSPSFDDRSWRRVTVPAFWETQGLKGYDGYGWYRVHFRVPASFAGRHLILLLGKVDDADETYLNGEKIGRTGLFGGSEETYRNRDEFRRLRAYTIPIELLKIDADNVLAVRVYDGWLHGGIYDGPIGLLSREKFLQWKPRTNDKSKEFWRILDYFFR
jgi:sialate O-acetylesterase